MHYSVQDDSGRTSIVFFDKVAMQLIGSSALELKVKLEKVLYLLLFGLYGILMWKSFHSD